MNNADLDSLTPPSLPWHEWLQPGDSVVCSHMSAEPQLLLRSLAAGDLPTGMTLDLGVPFSLAATAIPNTVSMQVMGGMGSARALAKHHELEFIRTEYPELCLHYSTGKKRADIVLISLAQATDGSLHLGASQGMAMGAARHARHVIAEINSAAPVIGESAWPDDIPLTHAVQCCYPIASTDTTHEPGSVENQIAENIASLIPDGACLQVGLGSLPSALLTRLQSHQHLGIHTGLLSDSLLALIELEVVDNSLKPNALQRSVTGCVYGSAELYSAVANNPQIVLAGTEITHAKSVLQSINNFVAINSAVEIDLLGCINTETAATRDGNRRYVGGVGGLPAYVRGALASTGGQSIIALPSCTGAGNQMRSRILSSLGTAITLDQSLADIVVTEYGVARLRGVSTDKRREQLIAIADPQFRDELRVS